MGTSLCDVTVTLKRKRKIVNIFFLKQDIFFYKKMYVWHFYQKMHTELHSGLHYSFNVLLLRLELVTSSRKKIIRIIQTLHTDFFHIEDVHLLFCAA